MKFQKYIISIGIIAMIAGCGGKGPTRSQKIKSAIKAGWNAFEAESYSAALEEFIDAFELDSTRAETQVGLGWTHFMIPSTNLATVFSIVDSNTTDNENWQTDAWSLLASANLAATEYTPADSFANLVLITDTAYVFLHKPDINWQDLLVIRGQALFFLAEYDSAWVVLTPLIAGTTHESIDPDVSTTWIFTDNNSTIQFPLFAELLAYVISDLAEQYRQIK